MSEESTKEELYEKAQELDIDGRSSMSKDELAEAVEAHEAGESHESGDPVVAADDGGAGTALAAANQPGGVKAAEEQAQHDRREARNAEIEEAVSKANTSPF